MKAIKESKNIEEATETSLRALLDKFAERVAPKVEISAEPVEETTDTVEEPTDGIESAE